VVGDAAKAVVGANMGAIMGFAPDAVVPSIQRENLNSKVRSFGGLFKIDSERWDGSSLVLTGTETYSTGASRPEPFTAVISTAPSRGGDFVAVRFSGMYQGTDPYRQTYYARVAHEAGGWKISEVWYDTNTAPVGVWEPGSSGWHW
jgi:hypothetical protein